MCVCFTKADEWPTGSVRSSISNGRTTSPVNSEISLHKHSVTKFQNGFGSNISVAHKKKINKQRKISASFTFLLACGLQIDLALFGGGALPLATGTPGAGTVHVGGDKQVQGEGGA